jgi:hypothetical protein
LENQYILKSSKGDQSKEVSTAFGQLQKTFNYNAQVLQDSTEEPLCDYSIQPNINFKASQLKRTLPSCGDKRARKISFQCHFLGLDTYSQGGSFERERESERERERVRESSGIRFLRPCLNIQLCLV